MDQRDAADSTEPTLAADATDSSEANEPTEPIESTEPAEPMDKIEPAEPMDKIEPLDPMLRIEPVAPLPPGPRPPEPLRAMRPFSHHGRPTGDAARAAGPAPAERHGPPVPLRRSAGA